MKNITEVVFGDSLCYEIKKSKLSRNNTIIKFDALFSICDLSNIDKDLLTLNVDYCNLISSEFHDVTSTYSLKNIINDLEKSVKNNDKIRIWTTHNQIDSYLMFLYVCNYFSNIECDLYVLFSDEFDKECYSPSCMNENELEELSKLEHKLTKEEIKKYSNEWKEIVNDNLDMRIIKNNKVISVTFDYYNDIILNKLNELGEVKIVSLIGNLLSDIHLYDTVFTYLISRLIKEGKIIITGKDEGYLKCIIKTKKEEIMKEFKELSKESYIDNEEKYIKYWDKIKVLDKSIEKGDKHWVFYDGPAFANGFPGLHHMVAKNLKDIVCKYKTMRGYKIIRKIGWDTHGLPIENHVEKKLGFKTKKDIEEFGIENFNNECRKSVRENESAFTDLTHKMGQFIDTENPYLTYKNDYIETEWWILKKFFEEGLFYEGTKVTPYCPRCGTGLASHEVAQGYKSVDVNTVIVPFKLKGKDEYFLVWTTTPWTLMANVGLCVNPEEVYVKVESQGYKFILAKALLSKVVGDEALVLEEFQGKELEHTEYEQLLPFVNVEEKAFFVTCDNYVTMEDGTGIVHIAPAFGEDDSRVGKEYGLPCINPVAADGTYKEGPWKGTLVFDADLEVIKYLKENDKLFKKQKISHDYPHCWRCDSPLLYYTMPSYYIAVSEFRDKLVEANSKVAWYPDYVGAKRFNNWLENAKDWAVSRTRYWGSPIPYFKCECGHVDMIGSIEELKEKSVENIPDDFDLHKPYIDNVHLRCPKCGKEMTRIPDVLDCWFDSGAMPFAQYHYPFENQEFWETQFPADFICEGIDQTRGWFYTLLVISTFVKGCAPYKNVLVNDLLLDAEGKKMSKSRGNIVEPFTAMRENGADTVRFYLPYVSPVWTPLKFDIGGLKEVYSKFFNPLKNTYSFFVTYANIDKIDTDMFNVEYKDLEEIDKWLLSKYNRLLKYVTESYEEYDLNKVCRALTNFVSEDLSNWYIRRNRDRFWESDLTVSKRSVYQTTYHVLVGLSQMIAPIVPYISEEIYQNLTGEKSVHLSDFPNYDEKLKDAALEEKMDLVRDLISLGRNVREETKIKVRQPISEILLDTKTKDVLGDLSSLIKEELNVKEVVFLEDLSSYMNFTVKPNFKEVGRVFGKNINEFASKLLELTNEEISMLENNKSITMVIADTEYEITKDMVDIRISSKEGFTVGMDNNKFVILNTTLSQDLLNEGLARETVSKVQQLRKNMNFDITDRINMYLDASGEYKENIKDYLDMIKEETLTINLFDKENISDKVSINEYEVGIELEVVKE